MSVDSLIGRDQELAELGPLVDARRLVTLTGPPGVGKSRLALEFARQVAGEYDRTWLVELAPLADGSLVPGAVASALSIGESPGRSFVDAIAARVREERSLVVLDNCEHLIAASSELVDALLARCHGLRIIATSREPLRVAGGAVWQVPTLPTPAPAEHIDDLDAEALMGCASVHLFVERAARVEPGFALNDYVAPAVAEICRRLDGIPLAIELAAARASLLTPAEIAQRLDHRFGLLTDANGGVPPQHHQTLASALDSSHELLSATERALFRRLSVFGGGFDRDACADVCSGSGVAHSKVPALLEMLVAKSLVLAERDDASGVRYRLLDTIRAFARDRLEEAGEAREQRESYAHFYLELAEGAEPLLTGPDQERWFQRLEAERANLRSALEWSLGHGRSEWALRQAGALVIFWRVRCHFSEGRDLLRAAVTAGDSAAPNLRAKALWGAGFLTLMAGDPGGATPLLQESLNLTQASGDAPGTARALLMLGNCAQSCPSSVSAVDLLDQSAAMARQAGDSWCLAHALAVAGFGYSSSGDMEAARPLFEECLAVSREAQDAQGIRAGLLGLGNVALSEGDWTQAEPLWEEAASMAERLGEPYVQAMALLNLGGLAVGRRAFARARELLDRAVTVSREVGPAALADSLAGRAHLARAERDRSHARHLLERSLALARGSRALEGMGELLAEEGEASAARCLFEEALENARKAEEKGSVATALDRLGDLARRKGETERAWILHTKALELRYQKVTMGGIAASLDALAGLAAVGGRDERAARLFGAASALREKLAFARLPWESARFDADIQVVRESLPADQFAAAWEKGQRASLDEIVSEALGGEDSPLRVSRRWSSLTASEQRVAALAAEGLANPEIAERLCISRWTAKSHLSQVYRKLGVAGRIELAREATRVAEHPVSPAHGRLRPSSKDRPGG